MLIIHSNSKIEWKVCHYAALSLLIGRTHPTVITHNDYYHSKATIRHSDKVEIIRSECKFLANLPAFIQNLRYENKEDVIQRMTDTRGDVLKKLATHGQTLIVAGYWYSNSLLHSTVYIYCCKILVCSFSVHNTGHSHLHHNNNMRLINHIVLYELWELSMHEVFYIQG